MIEGVALHQYVRDPKGKIVNYIIENVNPAFESILKMKKENVVGRQGADVYGVLEAPYLREYSDLKKGEPRRFEVFFKPLDKYFFISVSPWGNNGFATIFFDVTERKKTEEELLTNNKNLEKMNSLMVDRELRMVELKAELKKYNSPVK